VAADLPPAGEESDGNLFGLLRAAADAPSRALVLADFAAAQSTQAERAASLAARTRNSAARPPRGAAEREPVLEPDALGRSSVSTEAQATYERVGDARSCEPAVSRRPHAKPGQFVTPILKDLQILMQEIGGSGASLADQTKLFQFFEKYDKAIVTAYEVAATSQTATGETGDGLLGSLGANASDAAGGSTADAPSRGGGTSANASADLGANASADLGGSTAAVAACRGEASANASAVAHGSTAAASASAAGSSANATAAVGGSTANASARAGSSSADASAAVGGSTASASASAAWSSANAATEVGGSNATASARAGSSSADASAAMGGSTDAASASAAGPSANATAAVSGSSATASARAGCLSADASAATGGSTAAAPAGRQSSSANESATAGGAATVEAESGTAGDSSGSQSAPTGGSATDGAAPARGARGSNVKATKSTGKFPELPFITGVFKTANAFRNALRDDLDDAVLQAGWKRCNMTQGGVKYVSFFRSAMDVAMRVLRDAGKVQLRRDAAEVGDRREHPIDGDAFQAHQDAIDCIAPGTGFVLGIYVYSDATLLSWSGGTFVMFTFLRRA